jgi:hypothetical protein
MICGQYIFWTREAAVMEIDEKLKERERTKQRIELRKTIQTVACT